MTSDDERYTNHSKDLASRRETSQTPAHSDTSGSPRPASYIYRPHSPDNCLRGLLHGLTIITRPLQRPLFSHRPIPDHQQTEEQPTRDDPCLQQAQSSKIRTLRSGQRQNGVSAIPSSSMHQDRTVFSAFGCIPDQNVNRHSTFEAVNAASMP